MATVGYPTGVHSHQLEFTHPEVGNLFVWTGADQVAWGYGLNVMRFATYGGEVVQILSVYVDNLQVQGMLQNYAQMEQVYTFFLSYLQAATQGSAANPTAGVGAYNQSPMTFRYPHRGWEMQIMPQQVPGFRYGRDVVVPEWRIEAFVVDEGQDVQTLKQLIINEAEIRAITNSDENFGLEGKIRFIDKNPFSTPDAAELTPRTQEIADWYNKLLPAYIRGDFDSLRSQLGSKPAFGHPGSQKGTDPSAPAPTSTQKAKAK